MTITKDWLQGEIARLEAIRDEIPFGLDEDGNNTLAALKALLATYGEPAIIVNAPRLPGQNTARHVRDLVMMVKLLCRTVTKYNPGSQQAKDFMAYLQREALISTSDILRDGAKDPE